MFLEEASLQYARERVVQGHVATTDGGRARATVRLEHVAVDGDGHIGHSFEPRHGAQTAANESLNFLGAPRLLALGRLTIAAFGRGARQH